MTAHDALSMRIFDELTCNHPLSEDAMLVLVSQAGFSFYQRHIIAALKRGVRDSTIRLMLLKSKQNLDERDLNATIVCAGSNGYSEEFISLLKEIYI